jgi:hypothetical protein
VSLPSSQRRWLYFLLNGRVGLLEDAELKASERAIQALREAGLVEIRVTELGLEALQENERQRGR